MSPDAPSPAATYERACRLANVAVWMAALQRRRLTTDEPEDGEFLFRRWADFQFFIITLTRVRRAASLAAKLPMISDDIQKAIKIFDSKLPMLKNMRDVAEHFDDYAVDKGRVKSISRKALEVGAIDNTVFEWLGYKLDADRALKAARQLFKSMLHAKSAFLNRNT